MFLPWLSLFGDNYNSDFMDQKVTNAIRNSQENEPTDQDKNLVL